MRFNVIGHASSDIGLGIMACDYIQALADLGHEVIGFDVDPGQSRKGRSHTHDTYLRSSQQMFRDGTDIMIFPVNVAEPWSRGFCFGEKRVAVPLWELPDINPRWRRGLQHFDGIVSSSGFIAAALEKAGLNVWRGQHPHYIDTSTPPDRSAFGLPADKVIFTFSFDPSSDVVRKNPQAVVQAFLDAQAPDSLLCLQVNRSVERFGNLKRWLESLPADRVKVIYQHLSHAEAIALIAASDVYISLHRAEGFGLGMHEAMLLGKPVIATAWSGNMSFMDQASACLVDASLIPLNGTIPAYTAGEIGTTSHWAQPKVCQAAEWIRRLSTEPELREQKGRAARVHAILYQAEARQLEWLGQLTGGVA